MFIPEFIPIFMPMFSFPGILMFGGDLNNSVWLEGGLDCKVFWLSILIGASLITFTWLILLFILLFTIMGPLLFIFWFGSSTFIGSFGTISTILGSISLSFSFLKFQNFIQESLLELTNLPSSNSNTL